STRACAGPAGAGPGTRRGGGAGGGAFRGQSPPGGGGGGTAGLLDRREPSLPRNRDGTRLERGLVVAGPPAGPKERHVMSELTVLASPSRYVQGKGALDALGTHLAPLGSNPLLVADDTVWGLFSEQVTASFAAAGLPVVRVGFERFATPDAVDALVVAIAAGGHDVIVGLGGGQRIDAALEAGRLTRIICADRTPDTVHNAT